MKYIVNIQYWLPLSCIFAVSAFAEGALSQASGNSLSALTKGGGISDYRSATLGNPEIYWRSKNSEGFHFDSPTAIPQGGPTDEKLWGDKLLNLPVPADSDDDSYAELEEYLQNQLEAIGLRYRIKGINMAIGWGDGNIWTGVAGESASATGERLDEEHIYNIASITKTFVSAIILLLQEEGVLNLDDIVETWLPDLEVRFGLDSTIRQLLNHTSGLRDYAAEGAGGIVDEALADQTKTWSPEEMATQALNDTSRPPWFSPGQGGPKYSNTNYLLLGLIIESATGRPFAEVLRERILSPLQLDYTYFAASEELPDNRLAVGRTSSPFPFIRRMAFAFTAGGMVSNAEDLVRWARTLYSGEFLSEDSLQETLELAGRITWQNKTTPSRGHYGLGVQQIDIEPVGVEWGHGGSFPGYRSGMYFYPEVDVAFSFIINQDMDGSVRDRLVNDLKTAIGKHFWPTLSIKPNLSSDSLELTWDVGFLQSSVDTSGPWIEMEGATSPYVIPIGTGGPSRFYRLRHDLTDPLN